MENVPHWIKSNMLSDDLDKMGFSRKGVQERKLLNGTNSIAGIPGISDLEFITVGSSREGLGFLGYNDTDILEVDHSIICEKNVTREYVEGKTVLQIDENGATAGYCFLYLVSSTVTGYNAFIIEDWINFLHLYDLTNFLPLPNVLFNHLRLKIPSSGLKYLPVQGPSVPQEQYFTSIFAFMLSHIKVKSDNVLAFPCKVDHILQEWRSRERCGWPEAEIISKVMTLPTYVVPVGAKGATDKLYEWRISFVMAEIHLVESFNDTQTKVYVLMKIITKCELKPVCEHITSYVVKNVMFWLCEKVPRRMFKPNLLIHRLRDALKFLKSAVEQRKLPNYMIPKRNLFEGKFNCDEETEKVTKMLNELVKDTSHHFYKKKSTMLACIQQEAFTLKALHLLEYFFKIVHSWFPPSDSSTEQSKCAFYALLKEYNTPITSQYESGPMNMLSPYPYLLIFFLLIPVRLYLIDMLPQVVMFISDTKYLLWLLFKCYLGLFLLIQELKIQYRKPNMLEFILSKRTKFYIPKRIQRLEEMILFIFILSFTVLLGFTDLIIGINLPFMCVCFGLVVLSYQIRKFCNQFKVMIPGAYNTGAYINRLFQMRVLFPLLFAITIYVLW